MESPRGREEGRVWSWEDPSFPAERGGGSAEALLERIFELQPAEWLRRVPGRETFRWPGREDRVVKRFWGGEPRDWWFERLCSGPVRSPGRREAEILRGLSNLDRARLVVPRPLAWVEEASALRHPRWGGARGRSALVMECVPHVDTARGRLETLGPEGRRALAAEVLELVVALHAAGWYHRDLYLEHVVIGPEGTDLCLLDVGRARRQTRTRRRWLVKDLAALLHSSSPRVSRSERLRFLRGWLRRMELIPTGGTERAELRRWSRLVASKRERLAAHAPRYVHAPRGKLDAGVAL